MFTYLRPHPRDCQQWEAENLAMSTTSDSVVKLYDQALQQMTVYKGDPQLGGIGGTLEKMKQHDPDFVMGKILEIGWSTYVSNTRLSKDLPSKIHELKEIAQRENVNERERMHCDAVVANGTGNRAKASQIWEEILMLYPRDALAQKFAFVNYIVLGNSTKLRDTMARMLPFWSRNDPEYGYLLNMYAFGLEETNLYGEAEKVVKEGLELAPDDSWGFHAASHLYESTCRFKECEELLLKNESVWGERNFACHLYWHLSNMFVENMETEKALGVFDQHIASLMNSSNDVFGFNDGCQLLQKLQFEGVDVADRWTDVYEGYTKCSPDTFACYDDVLKVFSFPKCKLTDNPQKGRQLVELAEEYIKTSRDYNAKLCEDVGLDVLKGVVAYTEGRFDDAVAYLYPKKHEFVRLGGSIAQRDVFDLLLINSCLNGRTSKSLKIGKSLLYERKARKPDSPMTERMMAKCLAAHEASGMQ